MTDAQGTQTPAPRARGFNYCFWAKLLVAIPAFPLVAILAASFFSDGFMQLTAAAVAVGVMMYAAVKIDRMPCLLGKVVKR